MYGTKVFGASLIMSQVDSFYSEEEKAWGNYTLFGSFDGLRIVVVNDGDTSEFIENPLNRLSGYTLDGTRMLYQSKIQKQFFYVNDNNNNTKKELLKLYACEDEWDGAANCYKSSRKKPFIALFAIKLHPQYTKYPDRCGGGISMCIEARWMKFMNKHYSISEREYDCFAMRSLSADNIYLLVGMDKPWYYEAMEFAQSLNAWTCNQGCYCVVDKLDDLKNYTSKYGEDRNFWSVELNGRNVDLVEWLVKMKNSDPPLPAKLSQSDAKKCSDKINNVRNKVLENEAGNAEKLNWLNECIETVNNLAPTISAAVKKLEKLEAEASTHGYEANDWKAKIDGKEQNIVKWLGCKISTSPPEKLTLDDINNCLSKLTKRYNESKADTTITYDKLKYLMECINTIRLFGPIPVVLQTYTVVGYKNELFRKMTGDTHGYIEDSTELLKAMVDPAKEKDNYKKVQLYYRAALRPGVKDTFAEVFEATFDEHTTVAEKEYKEYHLGYDPALPSKEIERKNLDEFKINNADKGFYMSLGRYDYTWKAELSPALLVYLHVKFFRRTMDFPLLGVEESYSLLSLPASANKSKDTVAEEDIQKNISDELILNRLWAKEQGEMVAPLFALPSLWDRKDDKLCDLNQLRVSAKSPIVKEFILKASGNAELKALSMRINHDPDLNQLFDELSLLHVQGCQSFFYTSSWHEFDDARKFFLRFTSNFQIFFYVI